MLKRIAGIIWLVHSKRVELRETVHRSRALRVLSETYFRDIVVLQQRVTSKRTQISTEIEILRAERSMVEDKL